MAKDPQQNWSYIFGGSDAEFKIDFDLLKDIKHKLVDVTKYVHLLILTIDSLLPGQGINFEDRILLRWETSIESEANAISKDNFNVKIPFKVDYSYAVDLVLMANDIRPITKKVRLRAIDISKNSMESYFQERNKHIQEKNNRSNLPNLLQYLRRRNKQPTMFKVFCCKPSDLKKIGDNPIYRVTHFYETEGIQFINGYAIPAAGIWPPKSVKSILGHRFIVPW